MTIRQLRENLRSFEETMSEKVEAEVEKKEQAIQKFYDQRERELQEAGSVLSVKLQDLEKQVAVLVSFTEFLSDLGLG